jgi:ABC-type lipoprotein export system ATPase subunit
MVQMGHDTCDSPAVVAEGLSRSYRRGSEVVHALVDFSLTIQPGEMVAVVGRSGSGKTTFLNQVGCLDRVSEGRLWISGREVTGLPERDLPAFRREHIGFVFQLFHLIPTLTALQNVALPLLFGGQTDDGRAAELCARVGLDTRMSQSRPMSLSSGQRQRVAIARALVNRPRVLVADEPTGRLEHASRDAIIGLFQELRQEGLAIVMATHDLEQAARAARVVELRDGRIVGC